MNKDESTVAGRQEVIDDDIRPMTESPEAEVEDAGVSLRVLRVPFLVLMVRNHLLIKASQSVVRRA